MVQTYILKFRSTSNCCVLQTPGQLAGGSSEIGCVLREALYYVARTASLPEKKMGHSMLEPCINLTFCICRCLYSKFPSLDRFTRWVNRKKSCEQTLLTLSYHIAFAAVRMQLLAHEAPASEPRPENAAPTPPFQHQQLNALKEALQDPSMLLCWKY